MKVTFVLAIIMQSAGVSGRCNGKCVGRAMYYIGGLGEYLV